MSVWQSSSHELKRWQLHWNGKMLRWWLVNTISNLNSRSKYQETNITCRQKATTWKICQLKFWTKYTRKCEISGYVTGLFWIWRDTSVIEETASNQLATVPKVNAIPKKFLLPIGCPLYPKYTNIIRVTSIIPRLRLLKNLPVWHLLGSIRVGPQNR